MYMTHPHRRAGADHRRPAPSRWLVARAALLVLLVALMAALVAGTASAQEPESQPPTIGPGTAVPPPPPALPKSKEGRKGAKPQKHDADRTGKGRSSKKQGSKEAEAGGLKLRASCAPLSHTQTYAAWGPAVSYGRPVTVVYEASRCSTPDGSALDVSAEGTATIYDGTSAAGEPIDSRPFTVAGTWKEPKNDAAWPPAWWDCSVSFASYTWQIPGVYTFQVSAREGVWSLIVSSQGVASQDLSWTHDGCA